ncbi:MAG: serine/threonine-protein phosphatase [Clostridia bacterium]|nr:serine/threonine-protein phosphatase [Clostridia bacterium]
MVTYHELCMQGDREYQDDCVGSKKKAGSYVFAVADGLGGHGHGAEASKIMVDAAMGMFSDKVAPDEYFIQLFCGGNQELLNRQSEIKDSHSYKTTLNICLLLEQEDGLRIYGAHIGDTRLYFFQNNKLQFRTKDHSVPQMLVNGGMLKENKIRNHPDRNKVLRVLGASEGPVKYEMIEPQLVSPGTAILLCTDGFWEPVVERYMEKYLKKAKTVQEWMELMQKRVLAKGKKGKQDNYSAIGIWIS